MSSQWWLPGITRVAPFASVKSFIAHIVWHSTSKPAGKGNEVERPLVAVHELRRLARPDVDDLGEVQLIARRVVAEHPVERADDERVRRQGPKRRRAGDEAAGATGSMSAEVVGPHGRRFDEGGELGVDLIHRRGFHQAVDADATVLGEHGHDVVGSRAGVERLDRPEVSCHPASLGAPYTTGKSTIASNSQQP